MKKLLYVGKQQSKRRQATLPFLFAAGAVEAGHSAAVLLVDDAVYLANPDLVGSFAVAGLPSIAELLEQLRAHDVPVYYSSVCCEAFGVGEPMVIDGGGVWATPAMIAELMAECDAVLTL